MSEENVNIMRQGYDAFNRGDIDAVMGLMDPEIEWQEPDVEGSPVRGTHHGPEAVANNVFGSVAEHWESRRTPYPPNLVEGGSCDSQHLATQAPAKITHLGDTPEQV